MSLRRQFQVKVKQRQKRRKERKRLSAKGQNPNEYFYGRHYIKLGRTENKAT